MTQVDVDEPVGVAWVALEGEHRLPAPGIAQRVGVNIAGGDCKQENRALPGGNLHPHYRFIGPRVLKRVDPVGQGNVAARRIDAELAAPPCHLRHAPGGDLLGGRLGRLRPDMGHREQGGTAPVGPHIVDLQPRAYGDGQRFAVLVGQTIFADIDALRERSTGVFDYAVLPGSLLRGFGGVEEQHVLRGKGLEGQMICPFIDIDISVAAIERDTAVGLPPLRHVRGIGDGSVAAAAGGEPLRRDAPRGQGDGPKLIGREHSMPSYILYFGAYCSTPDL